MEEKHLAKIIPLTNAVEKKKPSELDELRGDMQEAIGEGILNDLLKDAKTKNLLKLAKPFIMPALKQGIKQFMEQAIKTLGEDDVRYMVYRDPETKLLVFQKLYKGKFSLDFEDPTAKDVFIIEEKANEKDRMNKIISVVCTQLGVKDEDIHTDGEVDINKVIELLLSKFGGSMLGKMF